MEESGWGGGWIGSPVRAKEETRMQRKHASRWLMAGVVALAVVAAACGSTGPSTSGNKGNITVAGFNFPESSILAELYAQALEHDVYTVTRKLRLGKREVVGPAIKSGQIDLYPGYAATNLEYYNSAAGEASGDVNATAQKLNSRLQPLGLEALTPSPAVDQNAFAVTKATADKYHLTKLSDLAPIGGQLVLGAGSECPKRPFCLPGLESVYGIHFKEFKPLDTDDNVIPIIRQKVATDEVKNDLNKVSAALTTAQLISLNGQVELKHQDPDAVARAFLQQHNYFS